MVTGQLLSMKNGIPIIEEGQKTSVLSYLLLLEHPPKVFIARVLIEPSSAAGQNVVDCGLHWLLLFFVRD
jgi:hypothetical protein